MDGELQAAVATVQECERSITVAISLGVLLLAVSAGAGMFGRLGSGLPSPSRRRCPDSTGRKGLGARGPGLAISLGAVTRETGMGVAVGIAVGVGQG